MFCLLATLSALFLLLSSCQFRSSLFIPSRFVSRDRMRRETKKQNKIVEVKQDTAKKKKHTAEETNATEKKEKKGRTVKITRNDPQRIDILEKPSPTPTRVNIDFLLVI